MAVPSASLQRALSWLNRTADKFSPNAQAYAWYVLAKSGFADPGRVRYFQDTKAAEMKGGIAWAMLAAALNQVGEPGRGRLAFATARQRIDERDPSDYYGSPLRNRAALVTLAVEAGGREGLTEVTNLVGDRLAAIARPDHHAGAGVAGDGRARDERQRRSSPTRSTASSARRRPNR